MSEQSFTFMYYVYSVSANNIWICEVYVIFITECEFFYKIWYIFFKTGN